MHTEYEVITDYLLRHLKDTVAHYLGKGWQLVGGISAVQYPNNPDGYKIEGEDILLFMQALAK